MKKIILLLLVLIFASPNIAFAQYTLTNVTFSSGVGTAVSSNYKIDLTIGEPIIGETSSSNYKLQLGFWYTIPEPSLPLTVTLALQGLYSASSGQHSFAVVSAELRSGSTLISSTLVSRKSAAVDIYGKCYFNFNSVPTGDYWLIVRAAGYLPLAAPTKLTLNSSGASWNFTTAAEQAVGAGNALVQQGSAGPFMLRAGDFNATRSVTATDANLFIQNNGRNIMSQVPAP